MAVLDYFIGTAQSKYAAVAIFAAIIVLCIAILITNTEITLSNRVAVVFFILVMSIFPVMIALFELTCVVTGGKKSPWSPCNVFAWFVAIMIVVYCFILIIMTLMSMFSYKKAIDKVNITENFSKMSKADANMVAQNILQDNEISLSEISPSMVEQEKQEGGAALQNVEEITFHEAFKQSQQQDMQPMQATNSIANDVKEMNSWNGYESGENYMQLGDDSALVTVGGTARESLGNSRDSYEKDAFTKKNAGEPEPFSTNIEKFSPL